MNPQFKQVALTWFRAAAAAVVAWLDPSATEFGRGSN